MKREDAAFGIISMCHFHACFKIFKSNLSSYFFKDRRLVLGEAGGIRPFLQRLKCSLDIT